MGRKTNIEREELHRFNIASLTPPQIDEGIKAINKQIKSYDRVPDKKHVLNKDGSDDLNNKLNIYGLKFTTRTTVSAVLKNLSEHKKRLESEMEVGKLKGRLAGLKEGKKELSKDKKQEESEEVLI